MKSNLRNQVLYAHAFNLVATLYGVYYLTTGSLSWLIAPFVIVFIYGIGFQAGYHRLIAHRSYKTHPTIEKILTIIGMLCIVGSPIAWASMHRQHHRYPDTDKDPHNPVATGIIKSIFGLWNEVDIVPGCGAYDVAKNKFNLFLHNHYFKLLIGYALILFLIDYRIGIFFFSFPATLMIAGINICSLINHYGGYRNYDTKDNSYNNVWAAIIAFGTEGWHNNHHQRPSDWNVHDKWWEFDLTGMFIRLIKK